MNKDFDKIARRIRSHKQEFRKDYFVKEIGIFGSYVRGEENEKSDIDILVDFEKAIDLFKFLELEEKISELTGEKVDLVSKKALKSEKRYHQNLGYLTPAIVYFGNTEMPLKHLNCT